MTLVMHLCSPCNRRTINFYDDDDDDRSTTCVDAAYCNRPSRVVCRSVYRSVTQVSPAKTAAPIEMPFGLRTHVGPGNHVLDGVHIPHGKGQFRGGRSVPL